MPVEKRYWGCLVCKHRRNDLHRTSCSICKRARPQSKLVMRVNGVTYFCHTDTSAHIPYVTIMTSKVGHANQQWQEEVVKVILPVDTDQLQEGMKEAVLGYVQDGEDMFSQKKAMSRSADEFDEEIKRMRTSSEDTLSSFPAPSQDGSSNSNNRASFKSPGGSNNLEGLSLFDSIMETAGTIAYDPSIGRYISSDTVHLSPNRDIIKTGIHYKAVMSSQKAQMKDTVAKTIVNRDKLASVAASRGSLDADYQYYATQDRVIIDPPERCSLCEKEYKSSRLLGSVTFKAVSDWRRDHAAPFPASDKRLRYPHDAARLCLFCTYITPILPILPCSYSRSCSCLALVLLFLCYYSSLSSSL